MPTRDPDDLLKPINQSLMLKGLAIAFAIHAVIIFGTSFSLYKDWGAYGFLKTPSAIKALKQEKQREADDAARIAESKRREAEREANAKTAEASKPKTPATSSAKDDLDGPVPGVVKEPEVEPLAPKSNFDLNDIGGI